jgi:hypothetical protein
MGITGSHRPILSYYHPLNGALIENAKLLFFGFVLRAMDAVGYDSKQDLRI